MNSFVGDAGDLEFDAQLDGKTAKLFQEGRQVGGLVAAAAGEWCSQVVLQQVLMCNGFCHVLNEARANVTHSLIW